MLTRRSGAATTPFVKELPDQSGRAAPFAVADLLAAISAIRPDAEVMALGLAELVLAELAETRAAAAARAFWLCVSHHRRSLSCPTGRAGVPESHLPGVG